MMRLKNFTFILLLCGFTLAAPRDISQETEYGTIAVYQENHPTFGPKCEVAVVTNNTELTGVSLLVFELSLNSELEAPTTGIALIGNTRVLPTREEAVKVAATIDRTDISIDGFGVARLQGIFRGYLQTFVTYDDAIYRATSDVQLRYVLGENVLDVTLPYVMLFDAVNVYADYCIDFPG